MFEDCVLDIDKRELRRGVDAVSITPQVFDLLDYLIRNRGHVVSKDDLISTIWQGRIVSDAALTTRLNAARTAIGDSGEEQRLIKTLPRKGFRFVGSVLEQQESASTEAPEEPRRPVLTPPDKPSIAVLPFANLNDDPKQAYLADGIVEDIITELSRFSWLLVIARNSSFQYKGKATDMRQVGRELGVRYVLEGSVRRAGDRIRVSAQLIDAATAAHRWAERFDRTLEDVFVVQDDVVRTIVAILAAQVRKAETERTRAKPPNSWQAYDYYLQALDTFNSFDMSLEVDDLYEVRRLLQRSLAIDPGFARSHAFMASTYAVCWCYRLDGDFLRPRVLDHAHELARKAIEFDPYLPSAHACLGFVLMWKGEHDASISAFERARELNPNFVNWYFGSALVRAGDSPRALDVIIAYMRLDPFHGPIPLGVLGFAHYMLKQYAKALPLLRECVSRSPNFRSGYVGLAATYAQLGQHEKARTAVAEVMRMEPTFTISGIVRPTVVFKDPEDDRHYFDGLRKAGLPD
jgi:adenylate cyclase